MGYTWDKPRSENYIDRHFGRQIDKSLKREPRLSNRQYWDNLTTNPPLSLEAPKLHKYPGDNTAQRFLFAIGITKDENGSFIEEPVKKTRIRGLGMVAIVSGTVAGSVLFLTTRENSVASDIAVDPVVCTTEELLNNDQNIQGYEINLAEAVYAAGECHGDSEADLITINQTAHDALASLNL